MKKILFVCLLSFCVNANADLMPPPALNTSSEYREAFHYLNGELPMTGGRIERWHGSTGGPYDPADLYTIWWEGGFFIADTRRDTRYIQYDESFSSNTNLSLFDEVGNFIISNKEWFPGASYSRISLELGRGFYHIGISPNYSDVEINELSDYMNLPTSKSDLYLINVATSIYGQYSTRSIVTDEIPEPTLIPEPSIMSLFLIGLVGLFGLKRKQ